MLSTQAIATKLGITQQPGVTPLLDLGIRSVAAEVARFQCNSGHFESAEAILYAYSTIKFAAEFSSL